MPLVILRCQNTSVKDLKPLAGTPLIRLRCHNTSIKDLKPLRGPPIVELTCQGTIVVDFTPLKELEKLTDLRCDFVRSRDRAALKGDQIVAAAERHDAFLLD